ncbi:MAG: hypothetical protein U9N59_11990 [Campylobacterota bacterium]|nr:hypothetical protein [Campylobacterota bacterium]
MKFFIYIILMVLCLNANDDISNEKNKALVAPSTELELLLFKIGFFSMLEDIENEKNTTMTNANDIKELKQTIKYILQQMNQNRLNQNHSDDKLSNNIKVFNQSVEKPIEKPIINKEIKKTKSLVNKKDNKYIFSGGSYLTEESAQIFINNNLSSEQVDIVQRKKYFIIRIFKSGEKTFFQTRKDIRKIVPDTFLLKKLF